MALKKAPRILIAPLDWGLGHATRCIPVIRELKKQGAFIIVAGSERMLNRLRSEQPDQEILLENRLVSYSTFLPAWLKIALQAKAIQQAITKEHDLLNALIAALKPDAIISDNRYGIWHKEVPSVLITHQLQPALPSFLKFLRKPLNRKLSAFLKPFDEIWIPDLENSLSLSGELSAPSYGLPPLKYIGWLSRFASPKLPEIKKWDLLIIVSGPEPQATIFLNKGIQFSMRNKLKTAIISAENSTSNATLNEDLIQVFYRPDDQQFLELVSQSKQLLVRSGYSTLMDLLILNRGALIVPTPGQTEQEYLGRLMDKKLGFRMLRQSVLQAHLAEAEPIVETLDYSEINMAISNNSLRLSETITSFLERVQRSVKV
jgi:predicted glycosyltransferase